MHQTKFWLISVFLLVTSLLTACSGQAATEAGADNLATRKIRVTTTVGMIADIVKNVGGDRVEVIGLMGPGVDPHLYKPSKSDVDKLESADIIFYGGLELEGRMTDLFVKMARGGKVTFPVSEGINSSLLREPLEFEGKYDPHIWFDVTLWQEAVRAIINKELVNLDPGSMRRWSTSRASTTSSPSARPAGGSWRSPTIASTCCPHTGSRGSCRLWHGDGLGRPAELGEALGRFSRDVSTAPREKAEDRLREAGLDERASGNLLAYLSEQREATGSLPTDRTLTVERSRDEVGDWRVILHSPYGMSVHAPWALAVNARIRERLGVEGSAVASDDGIIARVPDAAAEPPGAELFVFEAEELEQIVTDEVGGSALFASRFRECAARALLMPRVNPNKRSPLWQQRQRSAQLLEVARRHPTFPIILETLREVLQDVYDLPALLRLTRGIAERRIRLVETQTSQPSPFARDLLFGYVGAFMYEGDSPLAERRAAALSVDPALLSELLGRVEMRELLDPDVIAQFEAEVQRLDPERRVKGVEGVADLLRMLGPLDADEVAARLQPGTARGRPLDRRDRPRQARGPGALGDRGSVAELVEASSGPPRKRPRTSTRSSMTAAPFASRSPGPPGSRRSRMPGAFAMRWESRCPSASRTSSSNRCRIRSATSSRDMPARTGRSPSAPSPTASGSARPWPGIRCSASKGRGASAAASSCPLRRAQGPRALRTGRARRPRAPTATRPSGATPKCSVACACARSPRSAAASSRSRPRRSPASCPTGSTSRARSKGSTGWRRSSNSSPACPSPPAPGSP